MARELPLPCNHAASKWAFRISSHTDDEDYRDSTRAFCSVWVCARPECIDAGKRYVSYMALCPPHVIAATRKRASA